MSNQEIIDKLLKGEMKLYQVDGEVSAKDATDIRREFLEQKYGIELSNISNFTLDMERASARNIENSIGVLQLPMGIAGPLKINGENCQREVLFRLQLLKVHLWHQLTEVLQQSLPLVVLMQELFLIL